ncbi:MAG TPA: hypothetical protein VFI20_04585 [Terracidiphilus sp.]|nr:hypothetical protein [Terracidiphilus sp.]
MRATQTLVDQMGWVFARPGLTLLEIAWRWIFGIPLLMVCALQIARILRAVPPDSTGWSNLDTQNPWVAMVQLVDVWSHYQPLVAALLVWLVPVAALAWVIISGVGRNLVIRRVEPGAAFRPMTVIALQAVWIVLLGLTFWCWYHSIQWVAATHILPSGESDLVGYFIWSIFLSLGFFSLWAVISYPVAIAPLLALLERCGPGVALARSLTLGREFTSRLIEVNLVMGIARLGIIVLAMVFSAAPLPFSDKFGPGVLRAVAAASLVFYLVANDYFQVVRIKSFIQFRGIFRVTARK